VLLVGYFGDGSPQSVVTLEVAEGSIRAIRLVINPEKLGNVPPLERAESEEARIEHAASPACPSPQGQQDNARRAITRGSPIPERRMILTRRHPDRPVEPDDLAVEHLVLDDVFDEIGDHDAASMWAVASPKPEPPPATRNVFSSMRTFYLPG
jgi:hypothetical protein